MCTRIRDLQETGKLDQRTSTAVESLLSLSNASSDDGQWRPPSPASSISMESATFSPTRAEPPETVEVDQCSSPTSALPIPSTTNAPQSSRSMVSIFVLLGLFFFYPWAVVYMRHSCTVRRMRQRAPWCGRPGRHTH